MTDRRRRPVADARARRNLWVLVAAQVVLGSQLPVTFILGGLAGQLLAPNKCLATLPITADHHRQHAVGAAARRA